MIFLRIVHYLLWFPWKIFFNTKDLMIWRCVLTQWTLGLGGKIDTV